MLAIRGEEPTQGLNFHRIAHCCASAMAFNVSSIFWIEASFLIGLSNDLGLTRNARLSDPGRLSITKNLLVTLRFELNIAIPF